jgi:Flp pilus assembly protein TadD
MACFSTRVAYAQNPVTVDSLNLLLEHQVGCERFEALYELCFQYVMKDNVKALDLIRRAEAAALLSYDSLWIVKSRRVKGAILYYLERNNEAVEVLESVLPVAQRNGFVSESCYINQVLGRLSLFEGHYDKALSFFLRRLDLAKQLEDQGELFTAWHDIGICYYKLRDYDQALQYYFKALDGYLRLSIPSAVVCTNIALSYTNLGDLNRAREFIAVASRMSGAECPDRCQVNLKYAMGLVAKVERDNRSAEAFLLDSYAIAKGYNDTRFQLDNIYLLTEIFMDQRDFMKAKQYLDFAEDLMRRNKSYNLEMIKIYSRFSEVYIDLKDFKKASFYQSKYIALRDSIYREELTNSLMKVQANYLERENQAKLGAQREIILLNKEVLAGERKLRSATGIVAVLAVIVLLFVLRDYQRNKKLSRLLDEKVHERTNALELGRHELISFVKEQQLISEQFFSVIRQRVKTINGLCIAAGADLADPRAEFYVHSIRSSVKEIEERMESARKAYVLDDSV